MLFAEDRRIGNSDQLWRPRHGLSSSDEPERAWHAGNLMCENSELLRLAPPFPYRADDLSGDPRGRVGRETEGNAWQLAARGPDPAPCQFRKRLSVRPLPVALGFISLAGASFEPRPGSSRKP